MLTLLKIQDYMTKALRGETTVSPETLSAFQKECSDSVFKQLTTERGDYRIRMSGLGRPLCQQVLDKQGIKEEMEYNTLFRFMFGDLTESDLGDLMAFCRAYAQSADGQFADARPLGALRFKAIARIPG